MESIVLMSDSDRMTVADLSDEILKAVAPPLVADRNGRRDPVPRSGRGYRFAATPALVPHSQKNNGVDELSLLLDNVIKKTLLRSLEETAGNRRRAADLLGVCALRFTVCSLVTASGEGGKSTSEGTGLVLLETSRFPTL